MVFFILFFFLKKTGTVLHPQCRVIAENGPIYIGKNNIIEENVIIFNK